ncbi:MAG TPA: ATP-binding cassette domain-containing protein [Myxococcota bacterium]|nr:ATP-binding cassette domain-containing protein [Myxococcota bacterium]
MALRIEDISVCADRHLILKNLSFSLAEGRTLSVIGPSGSGKSTLVNTVLGLVTNYQVAGSICYAGQIIQSNNKAVVPLAKRRFSYIPQNLALWPHLSVWRTLELAYRFSTREHIHAKAWLSELLECCGLAKLGNAFPCTLSGGEKQRLAFARALAVKPRLLVLDEPFTALDAVAKKNLITLLKDLHKRLSFSLILISHDIIESRAIGEHVLVLQDGKIVWHGKEPHLCHEIFSPNWNPLVSIC